MKCNGRLSLVGQTLYGLLSLAEKKIQSLKCRGINRTSSFLICKQYYAINL